MQVEFPVSGRVIPVIGLALLAFLACLHLPADVGIHEQRVLDTARTMLASGVPWHSTIEVQIPVLRHYDGDLEFSNAGSRSSTFVNPWIVPVCRNVIRVQKPPLPYWMAAICMAVIGDGIMAARVPSALMGVLSTLLMMRLGRRTIGRCGGFFAGAAWVSSLFVVTEFRKAMADPYLAFATLLLLVAWIELSQRPRRRDAWILALFGAVMIGSLAKGPVFFLHAAIATGCIFLTYRFVPRLHWSTWLIGLSVAISPLGWWANAVHQALPEAAQLWRYQSIGQFSDNTHHPRPFWYYWLQLLVLSLPWILPFSNAVVMALHRPRRKSAFPMAWLTLTVMAFSFVSMKKNAYLLPASPAICLLVANGLGLVRARWRLDHSSIRKPFPFIERYLGVGLAAALAITLLVRWWRGAPGGMSVHEWNLPVGAVGALLIGGWLMSRRSKQSERTIWSVTVAFTMLIVIYLINKSK